MIAGDVTFWGIVASSLAVVALAIQPWRTRAAQTSRATPPGADDGVPISEDALRKLRFGSFKVAVAKPVRWASFAHADSAQMSSLHALSKVGDDYISEAEFSELIELCEQTPKQGLARIERMEPKKRRNPLVMFCRVLAFRSLIFGPPPGDIARRFDGDVSEFLRSTNREKFGYAVEGLKQIAEIERNRPDFFAEDAEGLVADSICLVAEYWRAGIVQQNLAWTKLVFFPLKRMGQAADGAITEQLKDVPGDVLFELFDTRFSCPRIVRSVAILSARRSPSEGWKMLFALYEPEALPRKADAELIGFLTLGQGKRSRFDQPGAAASNWAAQALTFAGAVAGAQASIGATTFADISRSDLSSIERLLSDISGKLSSLASHNPGSDITAVVNRLETANTYLREIASNTRR